MKFLILFFLYSCSQQQTNHERAPTREEIRAAETVNAVIVFPGHLRSGPGKGINLGTILSNTPIFAGVEKNEWRHIEISSPFRFKAWIQKEMVGCRVLQDAMLEPSDPQNGQNKPIVELRPGALLAIEQILPNTFDVETRGSISIKGRINQKNCGVGTSFVPTRPRDGTPHLLGQNARMETDPTIPGAPYIDLPEGQRFAVFVTKRKLAYGRTDGPVSVRGYIDAMALIPDKTTPFDRLAEPLGYTHETVVHSPIYRDASETKQNQITYLPGGTPLNVLEKQSNWAFIETYGQIGLRGWIKNKGIRRVALDHNKLDPQARQRFHVPFDRNEPREMEILNEDQE